MNRNVSLFAAGMCFMVMMVMTPLTSRATTYDHAVGLSYVSGFSDVVDFYDEIPFMDVSSEVPVGLFYNFTVNYSSGMRVDAGVGPFSFISGDVDYYDVPIRLTAGYTFIPSKSFRPYVRGGMSYHINDGDYIVDEPDFGLVGALGAEFGRRGRISGFIEVSYDTAEGTFEYGSNREEIKVHGTVVSLGVIF